MGTRSRDRPVPRTSEARENRIISYAIDLAEKQIREGTVSSQVLTHYLRLGTMKEKLRLVELERKNELMQAKVEAIRNSQVNNERYAEAIEAMKRYSGFKDDLT